MLRATLSLALVACAAAVSVGLYPQSEADLRPLLIPMKVDDDAHVIAHFGGWSREQSASYFLLSMGLGASPESRAALGDRVRAVAAFVDGALGALASDALEMASSIGQRNSLLAVPYLVGSVPKILYVNESDNVTDLATALLLSNFNNPADPTPDNVKAVADQLRVRREKAQEQREAFADGGDGKKVSTCKINKKEIAALLKVGNVNAIRSMSTLLSQHDSVEQFFPTFVINLWNNLARRQFMQQQLRRAGLSPAYLAAGVDASLVPSSVLQQALSPHAMIQSHVASSLAHIQVLRDIAESELSFALVLEDDVEFSNIDVRCLLPRVLPRLPPAWDLLYLDWSVEHFWSTNYTHNIGSKCVRVASQSGLDVVRVDGLCASGSSRAFLVSHKGAVAIAAKALPLRHNFDVYLKTLIEGGTVAAYALTRPVVSARLELLRPTQHNGRTLKLGEDGSPVFTFRPGEGVECDRDVCKLGFTSAEGA